MNNELIKENDKVFEVNYDLLDPNGNPTITEIVIEIDEDESNI
jgi:phosphotransferase system IIA component